MRRSLLRAMSLPGPVVSSAWLRSRVGDGIVVLDGTWHLPGTPFAVPEGEAAAKDEFKKRRIPGARFIDIDAIGDSAIAPVTPHNLPLPGRFAEEMARVGVKHDTAVVCYDTLGVFSSPRVWWMLRAYGCSNVAVLDGGLPGWVKEGGEIESGEVSEEPVSKDGGVKWELQKGIQWSQGDVLKNLETRERMVVDARSAGRFEGTAPEPRAGVRGGHMPHSRSLPFTELITKADGVWRMQSEEKLRAAFTAAGADYSAPLLCSCGSGLSASHITLASVMLGGPLHPIYDGAWTDYGSSQDTPIVTGPAE